MATGITRTGTRKSAGAHAVDAAGRRSRKGGTLYDPVSGQQIYRATAGPDPLNPGQMAIDPQNGQDGRAEPALQPEPVPMLVQEANRQYQLSLVTAQQKWQQDRDTQAYRQATVKARNDYNSQLLGVQRAHARRADGDRAAADRSARWSTTSLTAASAWSCARQDRAGDADE